MRKVFKKLFACLAILLLAVTMNAQSVKVGGEIRTRTEFRDGMKSPNADSLNAALVTNMRTRLNFSYTSNLIKAKMTLQDTRTFGQTAPSNQVNTTTSTTTSGGGNPLKYTSTSTSATNAIGVYEAWGEYLIAPGTSFTMGRQAIEYDDKRIFSASNWSNTGNAHDLLLLKYSSTDITAHLGTAWNNGSDLYEEKAYSTTYKTMNYLWLTKSINKFGASALWVNEGFQSGNSASALKKIVYRNTVGGNFWVKPTDFPVHLYTTGYYQFGKDNSASFKNLKAYFLAGKLQGKINKKLTLTVGEDYYSGSDISIASTENNTFNKLYGSNHSFNGSMEYWTTLPTQGLSDFYVGLEGILTNKLKCEAVFHKFDLDKMPSYGQKNLGAEIDLTINYDVTPELTVQGGFSNYFVTDAVKNEKKIIVNNISKYSISTPFWGYVMVTFKPKFL